MDMQPDIDWLMRKPILDFLIGVHAVLQLIPSTLFLAVNLMDRYCSKRVVYRQHYRLVGCVALSIAAKYHERRENIPTIKELRSICCISNDDDVFVKMELHTLQTLDWKIGHPTVDAFLRIAITDSIYDHRVEHMAFYILEVALFHREFVSKPSAEITRAALALSRYIFGHAQPADSRWANRYDFQVLIDLSHKLYEPSRIIALKYASPQYSYASSILAQFLSGRILKVVDIDSALTSLALIDRTWLS